MLSPWGTPYASPGYGGYQLYTRSPSYGEYSALLATPACWGRAQCGRRSRIVEQTYEQGKKLLYCIGEKIRADYGGMLLKRGVAIRQKTAKSEGIIPTGWALTLVPHNRQKSAPAGVLQWIPSAAGRRACVIDEIRRPPVAKRPSALLRRQSDGDRSLGLCRRQPGFVVYSTEANA